MSKVSIAEAKRLIYAIQQAESFAAAAKRLLAEGYDAKTNYTGLDGSVMTMRQLLEGEVGHLCAAANLLTGAGDLNMLNVGTHSNKASRACRHLVRD